MEFDSVRVRLLDDSDVRVLQAADPIYVVSRVPVAHMVGEPLLEPASVRAHDHYAGDGGAFVRTPFGSEFLAREIFVAAGEDENSEDMAVVGISGTRMKLSLHVAGMDGTEAEARLRKAIRAEFGPGVVEVWKIQGRPNRDLRHDVYYVRRHGVGNRVSVERELILRGVRDGHEQVLMSSTRPGWQVEAEPHTDIPGVDII